jgi:Arc/MetJ-type ribon-helix-helix transcriptional regulator
MNTALKKFDGASFLSLRQQLESRGIVFSYCGYLNENILSGIGNALQSKMAIEQTDQKISRGIFSTFVEQVQNVIRYSEEKIGPEERRIQELAAAQSEGREANPVIDDGELRYGTIAIGEKPDGTRFVTCANMILNENVPRIAESLESIRGLNRKELTQLMREHLKQGPPEGSKGAGVGFISIAREANGNWEYDMVPIAGGQFTFFCLEAYF